jgi:outer membrane protein assembly factor BamB
VKPRRHGLAGLLVLLTAAGLVVPILVVSMTSKSIKHAFSQSGGGSYTVTTPVVATPAGVGFYAIAPNQGSTTNVLRRVDPIQHRVLWSSPNLDQSDAGDPVIVAGANQVFVIFGTTLLAFDSGTGRQEWQASLSNGLASPCDSGCAVLAGSRLVGLSKDGVVQAFDTATGAQSWSKRLNSTPRWLEAAGSSVVVDDTSGTGPALAVVDIDAQTGATRTIAPSCAPTDDPAGPAKPIEENELFVSPDGSALTALVAQSGGCVVRYRLSDGAQVWQTAPDPNNDRIPPTLTGESTFQDANNLMWTNDATGGRQVFAINTTTGAVRPLVTDKQDDLQLVGVSGTTLVLQATPRYDPQKPVTVGVDLSTGTERWREASRVVTPNDSQTEKVTARGPIIVSCNTQANACKFEAIDAQTGTIAGSSTVAADPADQQNVHIVDGSASLLVSAGWEHVVGIDPATAATLWKWPS